MAPAMLLALIAIALILGWLLVLVRESFRRSDRLLDTLLHLGFLLARIPTTLQISQIQGATIMAINGITLGSAGTFAETPTPAGTIFPAGTTFTWTSDDTNVTLTPSADGTSATAQTVATDTAAAFALTCTSSFTPPGAGAPVNGTVSVPLLPIPVATPTGIQIDQTA